MEEMRKILEAINMEVGGIMADWSDPRSECREILRLTAQAMALSSPHPEAREEDIEIDELLQVCADYCRLGTDGHLHMQRAPIEQALKAYASRLAAQKDEVQALTGEQAGWLRMVLNRALYRVDHFPEQSNDEGIEADELARAIILLGGEPAASEPRLAAPKPEGRVIPLELLSSMFEALYYRREITETHLAAMRMIAGDYGFFISEPCPAEEPDGRKGE